MHSGTYQAASKHYSLPAPVDRDDGGKVQSDDGGFSFTDDSGSLFRIEEMPIPPGTLDEGPDRRVALLDHFLTSIYLPQTILKVYPDSTAGALESLPDVEGGARYCEVFIPKGSILVSTKDGVNFEHFDTARGIVYFIRGSDLFVISVALPQSRPLPENRARFSALLRTETLRFLSTIEFKPISAGKHKG